MHTGVSACPQGLVSCGLHVYITDAYRCKCMSTVVSKLWFTCVYN